MKKLKSKLFFSLAIACVALTMNSAAARTLIIEGAPGLPVNSAFIYRFYGEEKWLREKLGGKQIIESRIVFSNNDDFDRIDIITAIPSPSGKLLPYSPDFIVRNLRAKSCGLYVNSPNGPTDFIELDCSIDTAFVVRARAECAVNSGTWDAPLNLPQGRCIAENESRCVGGGGKWIRGYMDHHISCYEGYPDAGKECSDKSQCLGVCVDIGNKPNEEGVIFGKCEEYKLKCGDRRTIANGKRKGQTWYCD